MNAIPKPQYLRLVKKGAEFKNKEGELLKLIERTLINKLEKARSLHNAWFSGAESKEGLPEYNDKVQKLLLLGTHPEMIKVWKKFASWSDNYETENRIAYLQSDIECFLISINEALSYNNSWEELPLSKRKPKYEEIIQKMEALALELKHYDLDQKEIPSYNSSTNECFVSYDRKYDDPNPLSKSTTYRELYENRTGIQISDLLLDHALKLKKQNRFTFSLYKNPISNKDPKLRKFANFLAIENQNNFGAVHESIISVLASAFFADENASLEDIRSMIRPVKTQIKNHRQKTDKSP